MKMPFIPLKSLSLRDLRVIAQTLTRTAPSLSLEGHSVTLQQVRIHTAGKYIEVVHHVHSCYEAILVLQGEVEYADEVKSAVLREGDFQLYAPNIPHAWATREAACLRLALWFDVTPRLTVSIQQQPESWPELLWDTALLVNEVRQGLPGWPLRVTARLTALISRSLSLADWPQSAAPQFEQEIDLLADIDQFMRDNLHRSLTLAEIAAQASLSERGLTRHFRHTMGTTVQRYLFTLRMDLATQLLANPTLKIVDIANQVGIHDPAYFCACFRRHFHHSPGEYQQLLLHSLPRQNNPFPDSANA